MPARGGQPIHTTPVSLLEQLRGSAEPKAWDRLVALYAPLIHYWASAPC